MALLYAVIHLIVLLEALRKLDKDYGYTPLVLAVELWPQRRAPRHLVEMEEPAMWSIGLTSMFR